MAPGVAAGLPDAVRAALRDEPVPDWRSPTLATLTDKRFSDPRWIFERKFDGMRCLAFRDGDRVRLLSRNRQPLNGTYPELVDALAAQPATRFVLDGEVVAFQGRRTSFARLQGRLGITDPDVARASPIRVSYYVFDLLHLDGKSTVDAPLVWRKRLLRNAIQFGGPLRYTPHRIEDGLAAYRAACERGDEGVIAKLAESTYDGGRSKNWLKFKCVRDQEFVVGGYTSPRGSRVELGALLLGYYDGRDLVYAARWAPASTKPHCAACTSGCRPSRGTRRPSPAAWCARPAPGGPAPNWWSRSASPNGPATGSCATRATSASAPTRTPATWCARAGNVSSYE